MPLNPAELHAQLKGLFAFPVTPFTKEGEADLPRYREHLQYTIGAKPAAIFACGGTGEFFSLGPSEYRVLVGAAVEETAGKLPVIAGAGYGVALAKEFAEAAEEAGADGLLVMPPYLVQAEQEGLFRHFQAVARATKLGVIIYQRDNAIFSPATVSRLAEIPNLIGFKDGYGDMERLGRIRMAVGDRLALMNGMPTAELSALAFWGLGISSYSSAVFNFAPEISHAFYKALTEGNSVLIHKLLDGFYRPFAELRDRKKGYAVSLVKAGVGVRWKSAGRARPPLVNPSDEDREELKAIIEKGLALLKVA